MLKRLFLLSVVLALGGCLSGGDDAGIDDESAVADTDSPLATPGDTAPGDDPPKELPEGPRERVAVDETADASDGYDKRWTWAVHPNATRASVYVEVAGNTDPTVRNGDWAHIFSGGDLDENTGFCPSSELPSRGSYGGSPTELDLSDLPVDDYDLQVCAYGDLTVTVRIEVHY